MAMKPRKMSRVEALVAQKADARRGGMRKLLDPEHYRFIGRHEINVQQLPRK
jgi:hypothetical protein